MKKLKMHIFGWVIGVSLPAAAIAEDSLPTTGDSSANQLAEIIVTAQKRSQSINGVGMSIEAFSGDQLRNQGINNIADLANVVPGLTVQQSPFGAPAYSLRGVGFYESSLGAGPAVATYVDQIGIPYPTLSRLVVFDLERVEVLKGPQGTLYGQNSTGGAINFIAAKPTDKFESGVDLSYGRFDTFDGETYVSGPLSDTLRARVAVRTVQSGDWQESYTRRDSLGSTDQFMGRALLDWDPVDRFHVSFSATAWHDGSDSQAGQLIAITPQVPADLDPRIAAYPLSPLNDRAADWTPGENLTLDDTYSLFSVRADYALTDHAKLTSITAYQHYEDTDGRDGDAIALQDSDIAARGSVNSFSQELRLAGSTEQLNWIVGGNYSHDRIFDDYILNFTNSSNSTLPGFAKFNFAEAYSNQNVRTSGMFANGEYKIMPSVTFIGGVRYNSTDNAFLGGNKDVDGLIAPFFNSLSSTLCGCTTNTPIVKGGDYLLNPANHYQAGPVVNRLDENNVSYHAGVNWKPATSTLLYANVSKGYKAGSFPTESGASASQLAPAVQESVMAYEAGAKLTLADRRVQFNTAIFEYNYTNKQVRGKTIDPIFGVVEKLINVPKSRIRGVETDIQATPIRGLTLNFSGNFLDAIITDYPNAIGDFGAVGNVAGTRLPFTPRWQADVDGQYEWSLRQSLDAFFGASVKYDGATNAGIGEPALTAVGAYALLDLRAGVKPLDDHWRLTFWGKNVTNKYYWTNAQRVNDTTFRYAGRPADYGFTLSMKFQ